MTVGEDAFKSSKPLPQGLAERVQGRIPLTKGCRPEVNFADCPYDPPADMRNEDGYNRRTMDVDVSKVSGHQFPVIFEMKRNPVW